MKLSKKSIPYRAASKVGTVLIFLVFTSGASILSGSATATLMAFLGLLALTSLIVLYEYLYWQRYSFKIEEDSINITSGVFRRKDTDIPLKRVQNIDIKRNIIQRILGIAKLNLETAGGSKTEASLKYLEEKQAEQLRQKIRNVKNRETEKTVREEAEQKSDFELSVKDLSVLSLVSVDLRAIAALGFILSILGGSIGQAELQLEAVAGAAFLVVFILLAAASAWLYSSARTFEKYFNFTLTFKENALEYQRGLLNRSSGTIPRQKIQNLIIEENLLQRIFGYATLKVETAGYSQQQQQKTRSAETAIPLAEKQQIYNFAEEIGEYRQPELQRVSETARKRYIRRYLLIAAFLTALIFGISRIVSVTPLLYILPATVALSSVKAAELKWSNIGYATDKNNVFTRKGFWKRKTYAVPYFRAQNILKSETVFQKRWNLKTLEIDTAGSMLSRPRIIDLYSTEADQLANQALERFQDSVN
ncbi:MAG: PH domain-containing protein [Candidatus Nanohaloarchaea archaeon]